MAHFFLDFPESIDFQWLKILGITYKPKCFGGSWQAEIDFHSIIYPLSNGPLTHLHKLTARGVGEHWREGGGEVNDGGGAETILYLPFQ